MGIRIADLGIAVEDGEIFVAHIAKCGNGIFSKFSSRRERHKYYVTVSNGLIFISFLPTVALWATNISSVSPTQRGWTQILGFAFILLIIMFDYKNWVHRAILFTEEIQKLKPLFDEIDIVSSFQPPLTESEIVEIKSKSEKYIPLELINFWTTGSANLNCHYYLSKPKAEWLSLINKLFGLQNSLYGGASFMIANKLPDRLLELKEWAEETWIVENPNEQKYWLNSVPFFEMQNGDYLALDVTEEKENPPVIYLSHDDESSVISETFTDFLTNWESLCYIGPEAWLLDIFQNEKGLICSDSENAEKLRNIFSGQISQ